jgi:hypothetical protein
MRCDDGVCVTVWYSPCAEYCTVWYDSVCTRIVRGAAIRDYCASGRSTSPTHAQ